ncbi:hypothetical protein BC938DRAFT_474458 [Jimgerdemannia flammicorona]|uniref:Sacsin/Nov domain-containing protein n=1 Tax=Jimgerdemannia flammicorona TaxID=994334 RepID=A0A433QSI1_9FUNG|nr:hypothetical protein BC938DRAFT_474458 [Jimgerdemannia flammicorona]
MATNKTLDKLRGDIMSNAGVEEKVEVNQRHLIDKILARYSAEYVVYRELMQNADDATSKSVQIIFETLTTNDNPAAAAAAKVPNLKEKCKRVIFKNNGMPFRGEDWNRLKRIAEGNPDEQKIGAFGVGFYSLFSICEDPFVSSGTQCMGFYFKGDQLFAKRADIPTESQDEWTTFVMDLRESAEMPNLDNFTRFLATSLGFTANLREISVFFNTHRLFHLSKRMAEQRPMKLDPTIMNTTSPQKMFTLRSVDIRQVQLDAEKYILPTVVNTLLTRPKLQDGDALPMDKATIFLRIVTGNMDVRVSRDFEREMERSTKKKPPSKTTFALVFTGREELDASEKQNAIFRDLIPFPQQGRVFIGFPTHQTTGCSSHMATRFIPTVERESIDFVDRYIGVWNQELLAMGGLLCRVVYEDELEQIGKLFCELIGIQTIVDKVKLKAEMQNSAESVHVWLERRATHALLSFTFHPSTPSPIVGRHQKTYFSNMSKVSPNIITTHGVHRVIDARLPDPDMDPFVKTIPTIPVDLVKQCEVAIGALEAAGTLKRLGLDDVFRELEARPLDVQEMTALLKWWCDEYTRNPVVAEDKNRIRLLQLAIVALPDGKTLPLSTVKWWLNPKVVPSDVPVPREVLPYEMTKGLNLAALMKCFSNWRELTLLDWSRFISTHADLATSATFAEKILGVVSRALVNVSLPEQTSIFAIFAKVACVPTKHGMKIPKDAYFNSVKLFDDLPVVLLENPRGVSEKLLTGLGVRKVGCVALEFWIKYEKWEWHVELQLVFDRLVADGSWSHVDLVKYLTSIQLTLSSTEQARLKETPMFPKEGEAVVMRDLPGGGQKPHIMRYRAADLYVPSDILRGLGLSAIEWPAGKWRGQSDEAKYLLSLGLRSHPPLDTLLALAAHTSDKQLRAKAITYFIEHFKQAYESSYDGSKVSVAFLPTTDGKTLTTPMDCFTNSACAILGFNILHPELKPNANKFGVAENPPRQKLMQRLLANPPRDHEKAKAIFEYLASRQGDFSTPDWNNLRIQKFLPVADKAAAAVAGDATRPSAATVKTILVEPTSCYFESDKASFLKELFTYVDYGAVANGFLRSCGVKDEPTTIELAQMIVRDPQRYWQLSGGGERYLGVLRQIAGHYYQIKQQRTLLNEMMSSPFLIGIKKSGGIDEGPDVKEKDSKDEVNEGHREDEEIVQYRLAKAKDIFIADDTMGHQIFSPLSAPMEPLLEEFYENLGAARLSSQIKENYTYDGTPNVTDRSKDIHKLVEERTPIIIYQMLHDNPQRKNELVKDEKWLKKNLKVLQTREIKINRTFAYTGQKNVQSTTACVDVNKCLIYITAIGELDYYDVANALCRLLFSRTRFNDAIVFERYLTATLNNLRRKGVPVDRILNIKKIPEKVVSLPSEANQFPTVVAASSALQRPASTSQSAINEHVRHIQALFPDADPQYIRQLVIQEKQDHIQRVSNKLLDNKYPRAQPPGSFGGVVNQPSEVGPEHNPIDVAKPPVAPTNNLFSRFSKTLSSWGLPDYANAGQLDQENKPIAPIPPPEPAGPKLPRPVETISPNFTNNVRENLQRAIASCRPNSQSDVFSRPEVKTVTESRQGYCDIKPGQNLTYVGRARGLEFYLHQGINPDDILTKYGDALSRFVLVIRALVGVFDLNIAAIHVFYDHEGPTIAFNRNGSLFFNLRYYLALHDGESVGKRRESLIYWFFTACHELAHNFVCEYSDTTLSTSTDGFVPFLTASIFLSCTLNRS